MKVKSNTATNQSKKPYTIEISTKSLLAILLFSASSSFIAGRTLRKRNIFLTNSNLVIHSKDDNIRFGGMHPSLSLHEGKVPPQHKYSGMEFNASTSSGRTVNTHLASGLKSSEMVCIDHGDGQRQCVIDNTNENANDDNLEANEECDGEGGGCLDEEDDEEEDEEHLPAGQHLLIDIKHVDGTFLNSDVRLAKAMVDVVNLSQLTLLSYHCHNLIPQGVSCVGVLLESHISFHTWPEAGVITLDLFTCGSGKLVPLVPIVEKLFAIPEVGSLIKPFVHWVHKLRGFRPDDYSDVLTKDLGLMLQESFDVKKEIASVQTKFQKIDIFDLMMTYTGEPKKGSYEAQHPEFFQPHRIVYLDGVIQSTRTHLEAYHEALVHSVMITHKNPKRVAIIGGGEGATLKEVLKHNTLEKVQMIEIDEEMVITSREYLPEWSDCSDLIGSAKWCGDDERADIFYEDALAWFIDRFSEGGKYASEDHPKFDVIIMDALDPQDDISFAELLYTDQTFISSLYNALEDDGMIVFQLGSAPDHRDAPDTLNINRRRAILIEELEEVEFESFHIYEDGNCGFEYPWTFFVVMKDSLDDSAWYKNEAETQVAIHQRILRTHSGAPALKYFDGATLKGYQIPHKVFESTFCRQDPTPDGCITEETRIADIHQSDLEVKISGLGDRSGRGVFTKVDIKKGMSIGREATANPVYFSPSATRLIQHYADDYVEETSKVYDYMDGYGWQTETMGHPSYYVDSSMQTFVNHGCNGSFNIAGTLLKASQTITEQNAKESDQYSFHDNEVDWDNYNPRRLRHLHHLSSTFEVALRDIKAGEELFTDYLSFAEGDEWWTDVQDLKRWCSGEDVGHITKKEKTHWTDSNE
mmetsp:Transcript_937/g.1444  ORF Transcript_937/g.1444 Transcript_937/m.1444 type:complete len:866 (+) Transcript_937:187-2784(+)|eukprot:CAMPEP_0203672196 /NCGR_PEP_ID=MMETSP0090-20130426/7766_1 /ASSEMBLY_ACC=CAM_ASM_001088 /TAXON_ID=426623 /ORGANISM="Chaetoceros affinis, Strain CCMP159" /LENGTH=865 /DNA_ID=CAMNT_0050537459 /DNA_START=124 /DNA_END=2721 /DNA_ORIENTATION=-